MTPGRKERLIHNIACSMKGVPERILKLRIGHFSKAGPEYGRRVRSASAPDGCFPGCPAGIHRAILTATSEQPRSRCSTTE